MASIFFSRYVWLMDTIRRAGHISLPEISRKWEQSSLNESGEELPERTFHNHRKAIEKTFGVEIKNDRTLGYYIDEESDVEGDSLRQWMLDSFTMNNVLKESANMKGKILFEKIPSSNRFLTDITQAMKNEKAVEITYQSFHRQESNTFETHPYCLKIFKQRWYMLAKCEGYDKPRIYALDRIHALNITDTPLKVDKKFNAEEFFSNYFGIIIENKKVQKVDIKVVANQTKYIESLPLHHSQRIIEKTADYTIFRFTLVPSLDFKQEIMSRGCAMEVIAPQWFRDEIADDIYSMAKLYD